MPSIQTLTFLLCLCSAMAHAGPLVADLRPPAWHASAETDPSDTGDVRGNLTLLPAPRERVPSGLLATLLVGGGLAPAVGFAAYVLTPGGGGTFNLSELTRGMNAAIFGGAVALVGATLAVLWAMDGWAWSGRAWVGSMLGGAAGLALLFAVAGVARSLWPVAVFVSALCPGLGTVVALATAPDLEQVGKPDVLGGPRGAPGLLAFRF